MDLARANESTILRTLVEWHKVAPTRPANASDPFDPAYRFDDIDEFVRNAQQRGMEVLITLWGTPGWANGGQKPQAMPRNMADFQAFGRAVASRYSGRFSGYPFVRFFSIWNESNLATFLVPQFDARGRIVSPRNYARLAAAGYAGIKAGQRTRAGRDRRDVVERPRQEAPGLTDTVAPATFMKGVAAANPRLKFDAWAHHPYPFPVNQKPTQLVRYPNVTLKSMPRFEKDLDLAFRRKNVKVWITEYGNETKPGEPKGVTEAQQAAYIPQAIAMAREGRARRHVHLVRDGGQPGEPLAERHLPRQRRRQAGAAAVRKVGAAPVGAINGKLTVKGGTRNPTVTVYLREYCSNNPVGATVGYTVRGYQGIEARDREAGRGAARDRLHDPRARDGAHRGEEEDVSRHRRREHRHDRLDPPDDHGRRSLSIRGGAGPRPGPAPAARDEEPRGLEPLTFWLPARRSPS